MPCQQGLQPKQWGSEKRALSRCERTGTCLASRLHESPKRLCANESAEVGAPMKRSSRQSNQAQTCMLIESYTCNYACVCTNQIWGGIDISRIVCVWGGEGWRILAECCPSAEIISPRHRAPQITTEPVCFFVCDSLHTRTLAEISEILLAAERKDCLHQATHRAL